MLAKFRSARLPLLIVVLMAGLAEPAWASSQGPGMASSISTGSDGMVWFAHNGTRTGSLPGCAAANGLWVFTATTAAGQAMLANLLAATAAGKPVSIQGSGACIGDHESIAYIVGL
ncbi:hypothetical protein ASD79_09300 [Caulobacter sp. Root655]|uniref:hypothetical protein n=1 Tax=Caulobacter sp. Root655 TaxID=1736578 RepID=UPI0006F91E7E|nr:hypothetical protein [Caulobacter sp. Root655]KRA60416.1 hypothetical protein ASD79_09300 [Caulobacter sp. Root655]